MGNKMEEFERALAAEAAKPGFKEQLRRDRGQRIRPPLRYRPHLALQVTGRTRLHEVLARLTTRPASQQSVGLLVPDVGLDVVVVPMERYVDLVATNLERGWRITLDGRWIPSQLDESDIETVEANAEWRL
jgi:hypothetical protein